MSWIGGLNDSFNQISSFTGQIGGQLSTFTKEVLAEGADGEIDFEAEVRRLRMKLIEAEAFINEKEAQISKYVQANSALQERVRTAELEVGSVSHEYQIKLQQQQKIISKLKKDANISDDGFQILHEDDFHPHQSSSRSGRTFSGGSTDAAEFDDVISSQREVNRLSFELARAREECDLWKKRSSGNNSLASMDEDKTALHKKIKELQDKLGSEVERYQHEIISLQESNSASIRQFKEEIHHLRSHGGSQGPSHDNLNQSQKAAKLSAELEELKSKLRTRDRQLQVQKNNIDALKQQVDEHRNGREIAESSLKESLSEAESLQKECVYLEKLSNKHKDDLEQALKEIQRSLLLQNGDELVDSDNLSVSKIVERIKNLKEDKEVHGTDESWNIDKSITEDDELSRPFAIPRHISKPLYQSSPQGKKAGGAEEKFLLVDDSHHDNGDKEVSAVGGDLTLTLAALQKQVEDYELEIAQYEVVREEWQNEKESLQTMLDRYENELGGKTSEEKNEKVPEPDELRALAVADLKRELEDVKGARINLEKDKHKLLQEKERLQTAANNLEDELNVSISEAQCEKDKVTELQSDLEQVVAEKKRLETALKNVSDELNSSRMEKNELDDAIEMLDTQHQDEMTEIIQIRNNLSSQLKEAQTQLSNVKNENKQNQAEMAILKEKLQSMESQKSSEEENVLLKTQEMLKSEKEDIARQLQEAHENIRNLENNLTEAQEILLDVETEAKDAEEKLTDAIREKEDAVARNTELEAEISHLMEMLQQQARESLQTITEAESRVDEVESRRKKMEEEQKATLIKMDELKNEHLKVIQDMDVFREDQLKSEDEFSATLEEKNEEVKTLKEELALLLEEERKRKEELHVHESDAEEGTLLKSEIRRLEERLEVLVEERNSLKTNVSATEKKVSELQRIVDAKDSVIQELNSQVDEMKKESASDLQEAVSGYEEKMNQIRKDTQEEVEKMKRKQEDEIKNIQCDFDSQALTLEAEYEDRLTSLQEEIEKSRVLRSELEAKIKSLQLEKESEVQLIQERMQKSSADEQTEVDAQIKEIEGRFREETEEWEVVEKKLQQRVLDAEEECKSLHQSLDANEANFETEKRRLMVEFGEERDALVEKFESAGKEKEVSYQLMVEDLKKKKESEYLETSIVHQDRVASLEKDIQEVQDEKTLMEEELVSTKNDQTLLQQQLEEKEVEWMKKLKDMEEELEAAQNDVVLMSEHLDQEKKKWKKEMTSAVEKMRLDHKEEVKKMQQHGDTGDEAINKINELTETNQELEIEIAKVQKSFQEASAEVKQNYETKITNLESEIKNLQISTSTNLSSASPPQQDIDKMLQEIRDRDLSGWEKGDLSKEDISSLLEVIKERDQVINLLRTKNKNTTEKSTVDLEEKCRELNEERDQILAVISQKTKENRQLKDEIQRMLDTLSTGQTALAKVEEENKALKEKYEGFDQEMTKETVGRLSKLISERDLEIESLKQKCQTLLDVLQQQENMPSSPGGSTEQSVSSQQVQALLRDRETLSQQVRQLLTERDHLVALVNNKHQEALLFQEEARKASEAVEKDTAENSKLQVDFGNLVHDYEQLEMKLNSVQRELGRFKEDSNHLEETKEILFSKLEIPPDQQPPLRSDASRGSEKSNEELEKILEKKTESLLQKDLLLQETVKKREDLDSKVGQLLKDIKEKDILIHKKMEESSLMGNDLARKTNEVGILRKSVENLREQVASCTYESNLLREKTASLERSAEDKNSESSAFQETNAQLAMLLKEREYELEAMREKVSSVNDVLQRNEQGKDSETRKYLEELDRLKREATSAKHERDQIMLTLKQKQLEAQRANEELRMLRDKESKLQSELTRLRGHLVQVEETYTQEAVLSSDREQALRKQLEQIQFRSESVHEASEQSKQQVESLQEQLRSMAAQRDQVMYKLQLSQEQCAQYASALQQLQAAAERMQREEASMYSAQLDKIRQQYHVKEKEAKTMSDTVATLKAKLDDVNEALESASRLNAQLELKEQTIDRLKEIVSEKQLNLEETQDRLHALNARNETMVDKELVKNLLVGYFGSPTNKQPDVLRLIASVIGFTQDELIKLEKPKASWVGGWIPWGGKGGSPSPKQSQTNQGEKTDLNESFSQMFVKFLENESSKQPVAKLPAAEMVNEAQQRMSQRKIASEGIPTPAFNPPAGGSKDVPVRTTVAGRYNPFLAPSSVPSTVAPSSGLTSHPLIQPLTPILPTFTPVAGMKPTAERDLLQGILHNDQNT